MFRKRREELMQKLLLCLITLIVAGGCSGNTNKSADFTGIILEKSEQKVLIVLASYDEMKSKKDTEITSDKNRDAIWIGVENSKEYDQLVVGQKIAVWIDGEISKSDPPFAKAKIIAAVAE